MFKSFKRHYLSISFRSSKCKSLKSVGPYNTYIHTIHIFSRSSVPDPNFLNPYLPCQDCSVLYCQPVSVALPHVGHHVFRTLIKADKDHLNWFTLTHQILKIVTINNRDSSVKRAVQSRVAALFFNGK